MKIERCDIIDWKTLKDDIIEHVFIPVCKTINTETDQEIKLFIINKLVVFANHCETQKHISLIIEVLINVRID